MIYQRTFVVFVTFLLALSVELNVDLKMISNGFFSGKCSLFETQTGKQAQEVDFSIQAGKENSLDHTFNKSQVASFFLQNI